MWQPEGAARGPVAVRPYIHFQNHLRRRRGRGRAETHPPPPSRRPPPASSQTRPTTDLPPALLSTTPPPRSPPTYSVVPLLSPRNTRRRTSCRIAQRLQRRCCGSIRRCHSSVGHPSRLVKSADWKCRKAVLFAFHLTRWAAIHRLGATMPMSSNRSDGWPTARPAARRQPSAGYRLERGHAAAWARASG